MALKYIASPREHRYKCDLCGWEGKQSIADPNYKRVSGKQFPICPGCGEHYMKGQNKSPLVGYAVHETCGKRHLEGTPCPT